MLKLGALVRTDVPDIDPFFDNVDALLHFDGENNSTVITDSSLGGTIVTALGTSRLSTARSKFGVSSGLSDASNSGFSLATPVGIGTGDFTLEFWLYHANAATVIRTLCAPVISPVANAHGLVQNGTAVYWLESGGVYCYLGSGLSVSVWHHLAVCRSSGVLRVFLDGVMSGPRTTVFDYSPYTTWRLGLFGDNTGDFLGNFDEFRLTVGIARYTTAFTPPTAPFPNQ